MKKSQHTRGYEESEKEPCQAFAAVSDLNSDTCVHPSTKVRLVSLQAAQLFAGESELG